MKKHLFQEFHDSMPYRLSRRTSVKNFEIRQHLRWSLKSKRVFSVQFINEQTIR